MRLAAKLQNAAPRLPHARPDRALSAACRPVGNGAAAVQLITDLRLEPLALTASAASKNRYIWWRGRLNVRAPLSPAPAPGAARVRLLSRPLLVGDGHAWW